MENAKIIIIGTGSWGTALAVSLHNAGKDVLLWGRRPELVESLCKTRKSDYLPNVAIPSTLCITSELKELSNANIVLWTAPVQQSVTLLENIKGYLPATAPIVICSKGIDIKTKQPLSNIFKNIIPNTIGALCGPNFANEVALGLPAACTLAFDDLQTAKNLSTQLRHRSFRVYAHDDVIGVELSGALKNVVAIACGIVMGKELGQNCLAATITRASIEIRRLISVLGGAPETCQTLAGMGDLILTCSSAKSRNTSLGVAMAQGKNSEEILNSRNNVTEGFATTKAAFELARHHKIHTPIINAVHEILYDKIPIDDVIASMLDSQQLQELE